ncbi:hypothetical protein C0Q70_11802 [Pomacea canaliculata]|uniref:Uncharacterized protein n=1 Tax=Pomacea canaliculata TaxID=400727 RepID=A0A2T7P701_POMCA|nr:hypothetical protein C0Q70_11802 [Pomacea canaliculata]
MDRGNNRKNLEALTEEEDEDDRPEKEGDEDSESESEDDDDEEDEFLTQHGEPNKFDGLCDGVLNAIALVHNSFKEMLDLKDKLLNHALPPPVLIQLAMTSSRLFRSISDLNMTVNELVRLVRLFSTPWEEKSAALKKLHEDYESKQRQLNIAIKRLQLVDAHSKRIAREKRIMNWEKLFTKVTSSKGHGRRWKFLIETIKQKARMGLEHVQAYTQALEESSESEDEDVADKAPIARAESGLKGSKDTDEQEDSDDTDNEEADEESGFEGSEIKLNGFEATHIPIVIHVTAEDEEENLDDTFSRVGSPKKVRFNEETVVTQAVKPPVAESAVWTGEPEYDRSLFVRVYCPDGLQQTQLRCTLTCNDQIFKTGILDPADDEESEVEQPAKRPKAAVHGMSTTRPSPEVSLTNYGGVKKHKKFKEFEILVPEEVPKGALQLNKQVAEPANIQVAVHHGQYEELFAMASINFQDIKESNLQTVYLQPVYGNDTSLQLELGSSSDLADFDSVSDSVELMLPDDNSDNKMHTVLQEDQARDINILPFPLYPLHAGRSDALHKPCGTVPLMLFWGKRERPRMYTRQTGTLGLNDLVFELTGIDLSTTTKEDLHKEAMDRSTSAVIFTPDVQEETVTKLEYDQLVYRHQEELQYIQEEYERRLQELMQSLEAMQEENLALSQQQQQQQQILRPLSTSSHNSRISRGSASSPGPVHFIPMPPKKTMTPRSSSAEKTMSRLTTPVEVKSMLESGGTKSRSEPPRTAKSQRKVKVGHALPKWGESLPQDFFERLRLFQEESKIHKQELSERTLKELKDSLEKKLAGQHKLSKQEELVYDALKDVSLPALFMPLKTGNIFNPRAHQYFHPTGTTDVRLTQPPSVFQLPPLPSNNRQKLPVVNLFELSKNFHRQGAQWLVERYIQQQQPLGTSPETPLSTANQPHDSADQLSPMEQEQQLTSFGLEGSHSAHASLPEQEVEA